MPLRRRTPTSAVGPGAAPRRRGLDRAGYGPDLTLLLRASIPIQTGFGVAEILLGLVIEQPICVASGLALLLLTGWTRRSYDPSFQRIPVDRFVIQLAVAAIPATLLTGFVLHATGMITALLPAAISLPYLEWRRLRWILALSLAEATLITIGAEALPGLAGFPVGIRVGLDTLGLIATVSVLALLVAQYTAKLRAATTDLAAVVKMSNDLAATLDASEIANLTCRAIALAVGADEAAVCYLDPAQDRVLTYAYYPPERRGALAEAYDLKTYPATRRVLEEQVLLKFSDDDPAADPAEIAYLHSIGQRSMVMVPLVAKGRVLGTVEVTSARAAAFDDRMTSLAQALVAEAAIALENGRLYEELRERAFHDSVTGLANRDLLSDRIAHALARRPSGPGDRVAVLLLDLDDFKTINDSFGHAGGDELLAAVAVRLRGCLRPGDTAARLGGDEFAVLLEDAADERDATTVAQRLIDALRAPIRIGQGAAVIGASIGIALGAPGRALAANLMLDADFAMYRAKSLGKGRFEVFHPAMRRTSAERSRLDAQLRKAVAGDELRVHYQPQVSLADGTITGVEALVRWDAPGRGLLMPGAFIGLAEESGVIIDLGRWVLAEACRQAAEWRERMDLPSFAVGVNLSARQFQHPDLVAEIGASLTDSGLPPENLALEITESILMAQTAATIGKLADLRHLGVRLAIDDFGTGYSSLGYLERFPVDILKIDKTFIDGIGRDRGRPVLAQAIVHLGRALDLEVVAEGIERPEQVHALRRLGCTSGQGYLYSRPVAADALGRLLVRGRIRVAGDKTVRPPTRIPIRDQARGIA